MRRLMSRVMWSAWVLWLGACGGTELPEPELAEVPEARAQGPIEDCPIVEVPVQAQAGVRASSCAVCGNGICDANESDSSCPSDCSFCGDGVCNGWENSATCSADCGSYCGDGFCTGGETIGSCLVDCGPKLRSALLYKVRHCRNNWPCNSRQSRDDFHWWDDFGVATDKQKRTYIATPLNPPRQDVRHLVFIAAGQQFDAYASGLTGQYEGYKSDFEYDEPRSSKWVNLAPNSLASQLVERQYRSSSDTFMGLAFDARFNYGFSNSNKQDIENAYYEWLKEKAFAWNLQSIYLAGHSRGGCLVSRLARRFKLDFPSIPLIVHVFDGVCHKDDGEFGVTPLFFPNPVTNQSGWFAYSSDIGGQFSTTQNLAFYNMVSGDQVMPDFVDLFSGVHAFGYWHPSASSSPSFTVGDWYRQQWYDAPHMTMSRWSVGDALSHYRTSCNRFGC